MKRNRMSLAVAATVAGLTVPLAVQASTVEELSAQMAAMQKQMMAMQEELTELREKDAAGNQFAVVEADYGELKEEVMYLREDVDDIDDRLMAPEKHAALDGLTWGGDFRVQAHSIEASIPDHISGTQFQSQFIGALQSYGILGDQFTFQ